MGWELDESDESDEVEYPFVEPSVGMGGHPAGCDLYTPIQTGCVPVPRLYNAAAT